VQTLGKPICLPLELERRYIAGKLLEFVPLMSAIGGLALVMKSQWWALILAKYALLLLLIGWLASRRVEQERRWIEEFAELDPSFALVSFREQANSNWVPLLGAVLTLSAIHSIIDRDIRWFIVVGAIGGLLALGLGLRWLVYSRWLYRQLREIRTQ
jgi:hypothetical protein